MFTLRRITDGGKGLELNQSLGTEYTIVYRHQNYEEFIKCFKVYYEKDHVADNDETADADTKTTYAFISHHGGTLQPLWTTQKAFIMTENGKTFDNLSYK